MREPQSKIPFPASVALFALGYYVAARFGLTFRFQYSQIGVVWPATALVIAALILTPRPRWWIVLLSMAAAHAAAVGHSVPLWRLLWQIAGNAAFATATVAVLRRLVDFPLRFGTPREVVVYIMTAVLAPLIFGFTTPAFVLACLGVERTSGALTALIRTMLANATAMLLTVPVVVLSAEYGFRRLRAWRGRRAWEAAGLASALVLVGLAAFGTGPQIANLPSVLLWIFPPLLWAAIRFGSLGASISLFSVAAMSLWGTARQVGPFVLGPQADQILSLQLFWIVLCPPVMLLAAVIREREETQATLEEQRNQLAHVTRVATIGEMSGALAHELSQPLAAIQLNAQTAIQVLSRHPGDVRQLRDILEDITRQNMQASEVITRQRAFLKQRQSRFERVSIDAIARDALSLGRSRIHTCKVDVDTQIAPGLPSVQGDAVQLLQVVLNLIVNACDAMSGRPVEERRLCLRASRTDAKHVEVSVSDHGVGLPRGSEEHVFKPFFTTKDHGLGLGLAICRTIAEAHHGRLWAENNPDGGATFHLRLPADD